MLMRRVIKSQSEQTHLLVNPQASARSLPAISLQFVIVTGVPVETDLKKFSAMNSGMRMQPWEAG
jgi:hypothetical protein